jgi:hypothetical protein
MEDLHEHDMLEDSFLHEVKSPGSNLPIFTWHYMPGSKKMTFTLDASDASVIEELTEIDLGRNVIYFLHFR